MGSILIVWRFLRTLRWRWWPLPLVILYSLGVSGLLGSVAPGWSQPLTVRTHDPIQAMADGHQAFARGDFASAVTHWQQAAHEYTARQELQAHSIALTHLARAYEALGHTDQAAACLQRALPLAEAVGDQAQSALILGHQGELALAAGQVSESEQLVHAALGRAWGLEDAGLTATLA